MRGELNREEIHNKSISLRMERDKLTEEFQKKIDEALLIHAEILSIKGKLNAKHKEIDDFILEYRYLIN